MRRQLAAHDLTSELTSFWARLNVQLLRGETFAFQNLQKTRLKKAVSVRKPDDTYLSEYSTWEPCIASSGVLQTSPPLGTTAHSKTLPGTGCTFRIETGAPPAFGISRCCTPEAEHLLRVSSRPAVAFISESTQHDTNQQLEPFCCLAVRGSWWRCVTAHSATDSPARRSCRPLQPAQTRGCEPGAKRLQGQGQVTIAGSFGRLLGEKAKPPGRVVRTQGHRTLSADTMFTHLVLRMAAGWERRLAGQRRAQSSRPTSS